VRFLVDNAISPLVRTALLEAGHDAVHARDLGLHAAADEVLFDLAAKEQRQAAMLLANLPALVEALGQGSMVTIEPTRIRIRRLPLN